MASFSMKKMMKKGGYGSIQSVSTNLSMDPDQNQETTEIGNSDKKSDKKSENRREILRNPDKESENERLCITICSRVCSGIIVCGILVLLILFIYAYIHETTTSFDVPDSYGTNDLNCTIQFGEGDSQRFNELVKNENYDSLFVRLETIQNISKADRSYIYEPDKWIWVKESSAILNLPSSYPVWSFGILDRHTKRDVTFHMELSPPGCEFEWGAENTEIAVGQALVNFTLSEGMKYKWCYSVKLRNGSNSQFWENNFSFFIQDLGYKCCHNHHVEGSGEITPSCSNEVLGVQRIWTHLPFILSFLTLLIFPNIMVYIYQFLSFKSHVYWTHHRHELDVDEGDSKSKWIYTDYKSSVSFLSCLRFCTNERSEWIRECLRVITTSLGIVALSLLLVLIPVLLYLNNEHAYQMLLELTKNKVPIGFLSLLFPDVHDNFLSWIRSPYIFLAVYICCASLYLIIFRYNKAEQNVGATSFDEGKFYLNLDLVEKYGRIQISNKNRHSTFETFHANVRAIFRGSFWRELWSRLIEETSYLEWFVLPFALLFSFLVHCIPFLFASLLIFNNIVDRINKRFHCPGRVVIIFGALLVHLAVNYCIIMIYFGSAEFVCFVISFCVLAIIIFPTAAPGIFVYALIAFYYGMDRFRQVARKYAAYRDIIIKVSESLNDKCKFAEARVKQRDNYTCLLISGVDINLVSHIVIVKFPKRMAIHSFNGLHCHLKGDVLKVVAPSIPKNLREIKICGVSVNISDFEVTEDKIILKVDSVDKINIFAVSNKSLESKDDAKVNDKDDTCFVTYRNGLPGIPEDLLDRAVHEYMPVGAERIHAIIWFLVVVGVVVWLAFIINLFLKVEQMYTILNALIAVFLLRLANIMEMFSVDVTESQKMEIKKGGLRLTILEFWTEKRFKKITTK